MHSCFSLLRPAGLPMVWLRPLGGASTSSAPRLDDASALEQPADAAARQQLEAALQQKQAARQAEFSGALDALHKSPSFVPVGTTLTTAQLAAIQAQPSSYNAGVVGAAANPLGVGKPSPRRAKYHNKSNQPRSANLAPQQPPAAEADAPLPPPPPLADSSALPIGPGYAPSDVYGGIGTTSLFTDSTSATATGAQRAPEAAVHVPGTSPRSRSLVHLETLPSSLAAPALRPVSALGAACGPAGLGARGDDDLSEAEHALLLQDREHEQRRRMVAPQPSSKGRLPRSVSAPLAYARAAEMQVPPPSVASTSSAMTPSSRDLAHAGGTSSMVRLPTAGDLRKAAHLENLVPPQPNDSLQRVLASERRQAKYGMAAVAVKLAPAPTRFSSMASRLASPAEFFASHGMGGGRGGGGGLASASVPALPHAGRGAARQLVSMSGGAGPSSGLTTPSAAPPAPGYSDSALASPSLLRRYGEYAPPPSRESAYQWDPRAPSLQMRYPPAAAVPAAPPAAPPALPNFPRDWVHKQAGLASDFAARRAAAASAAAGGSEQPRVRVPWREEKVADGLAANFIYGKPQPAPPRGRHVQGVPWIAGHDQPRTGRSGAAPTRVLAPAAFH